MELSGKTRKAYGVDVPVEYSALDIELLALKNRHSKEDGGLGHQGHLTKAMMLMWPHKYAGYIDDKEEWPRFNDYAQLITWAWCNYEIVSAFGHAAAAKSHTLAHIIVAEWLAAATETAAVVTSTHMQGLRNRIFQYVFEAVREISHLMPLNSKHHPVPVISLPGGDTDKLVIQGIATNRGDEAVTKIQGIHANRVIVCIDEAAGTPQAIFDAAANLQVGTEFFRQVMLMNPDDLSSHAATWAEPPEGFKSIDPNSQPWWETRREGGVSIHFSWNRCPNKLAGKTVYPYLLNEPNVDKIRGRYGEDSPQYYTFALGWFPPTGLQGYVFNEVILDKAIKPHDFPFKPIRIAALDPAFEGGDMSALAVAEYYAETHQVNLMDVMEVKIDASTGEPMDYMTAQAVMSLCSQYNVKPENFILDVTGGGRGVHNFLVREWSSDVLACNFGGGATERKIKPHDPDTSKDILDRFVSELWWAARAFMEEGLIGGIELIKFRELREELMARRYSMKNGRLISVEKKDEMKARLGRSPDRGDAFCLLIELIRRRGAVAFPDGGKSIEISRPLLPMAQKQHTLQVETWGDEPRTKRVVSFDAY